MVDDPNAKLAVLRTREWATPEEFESLNREYEEALSELARSISLGSSRQLASVAGTNFRDRQSLKRKADRWKSTFQAMPPIERAALLAALCEAITETDAES